MRILTSPFSNPFINLALEDYFLRYKEELPILFFYVNRPCVVMGRFQNPWIETNLSYLSQNDIWLVRRQSGGGCVFHDMGNLNFSFIVSGSLIDRVKHAKLLQDAFKLAGIELSISPRNDLWMKDTDGVLKKISGSAYKQTKLASFHHGTVLVSSDLMRLETSLTHTLIPKTTKSIPSVRSVVTTLQTRYPEVEIGDVIELISHFFKSSPIELDGSILSLPEVQKSFSQLRSWDWLWGETPLFEMPTPFGELPIRKGIIQTTLEPFSRESMRKILTNIELDKLFPDFSEQHRLSNQIW